jgi:AraC family transcriptional regulator, arabinose operon regulatory protein
MSYNIEMRLDSIIKIQDLGFHKINNEYSHPNRTLDWNVFLYVASGEMEVWEGDTEYVIKKGEYLFLKSGLHHWGEPKTPAGTSWYWIHFFSDNSLVDCQELNINLNSYQSLSLNQDEYDKYIQLPKQGMTSNGQKFEARLDSIIQLSKSSNPFRAVSLSMQTMELFFELYNDFSITYPLTKSDRTVQRLIDYLEQKESYSLDSEEISTYLDMNYSYLCEVFKSKTGNTIQMYNSQVFMDKAVKMMRNSNMNISEISEILGFKNPFYFSRVFRKVNGIPPSDYMSRIYRTNK